MTAIRFPKRRADGSFTVGARFATRNPAITGLVHDYVAAWMRANRTWVRIWRSNTITEERWDFDSEFLTDPRVEAAPDGKTFSIVFEGRPSATRWKDWVVYLAHDISTADSVRAFELLSTCR
jgi:hypothetical protein